MLKKIDVNDATLANIFLETKALQDFLADPVLPMKEVSMNWLMM
jgi:hypothetical protein